MGWLARTTTGGRKDVSNSLPKVACAEWRNAMGASGAKTRCSALGRSGDGSEGVVDDDDVTWT